MTEVEPSQTIELDETQAFEHGPPGDRAKLDIAETLPGRTFDRYTIDSFLGKGGMAWVFLAKHNSLQRPCAVKILSPDLHRRDASFLDMFIAEARSAASVVHPNIVTVHDVGQLDEYSYIELEYVVGQSLQEILKDAGQLSPFRATYLLAQACEGLAEAHRHDLIHRDFKPSNVLVNDRDRAKLADFGLAKRVSADATSQGQSLTGTPYFMAPELFAGEASTRRSDVYAVGVSYYYLLTGQFPFVDRKLSQLAGKHANEPVPDARLLNPRLPAEVIAAIEACMAKDVGARPEDGQAVYDMLMKVYRQLRELSSLVDEAMAGSDVSWTQQEEAIELVAPLEGGRSQRVRVESCKDGPWQEEIVRVFSVCCPISEHYFRRALELNADITHGSVAIDTVDGTPCFVMINSYPRATCDAEEIRRSVLDIAKWADEVERILTGEDKY